jgi:hypothetical protein
MFNSINNKLNVISNGYPNRRTPLMLINNGINGKNTEKEFYEVCIRSYGKEINKN